MLLIGQEFLDAFPVHQFSLTEKGWREKLVDLSRNDNNDINKKINKNKVRRESEKYNLDNKEDTKKDSVYDISHSHSDDDDDIKDKKDELESYHFRYVLSPSATPAVKSLIRSPSSSSNNNINIKSNKTHHHHQSHSQPQLIGIHSSKQNQAQQSSTSSTTATTTSTTTDSPVVDSNTTTLPQVDAIVTAAIGDGLEISPLAIATCEDVAKRIVKSGESMSSYE